MATQKRQPGTSLKERLFKEFFNFSFFQAVSIVESLSTDKIPLGKTLEPGKETIRFSVKPDLGFPASDISGMKQDQDDGQVDMEVTFMGMIGPSGVLPHWYTELAMERNRNKDYALTTFFNLFHHRLISLFYLAWKKYRFPANYLPGAQDRLSKQLLSLLGLGTSRITERLGLSQEPLLLFSGLLSKSVLSAADIETIVEYHIGIATNVEQFIERLIPISPEDQTRLGMSNAQIGVDAICGDHAWENQTKFRINLGPMDYKSFRRFQRSGDMLQLCSSLIRYMVGMEYEFEFKIFLKREEVPPIVLGQASPDSPRLGWSTWLNTPGILQQEDPHIYLQEQ